MLASLIIALLVVSPLGPMRVILQLPFATMAACTSWLDDPTPVLVHGAQIVGGQCVDKPTNPGKPT